MNDKMIIFGSGQIGHDALVFFGSENIDCFCDNNPVLRSTEKYGKTVVSFDDLKTGYREAVVMIAVAGASAYDIVRQCEENGIQDYLVYSFLRETCPDFDGKRMLALIERPEDRLGIRKDIYLKRTRQLEEQLQYFMRHADIHSMKPARGELRRRQRDCVRVSAEFFRKIGVLGISPMLYAGNLLGYVRHGGFIPWDDDIDFALIRKEYEMLKTYCRKYMYSSKEWDERTVTEGKEIAPGMEGYFWFSQHDYFSVVAVFDNDYRINMDFFSLDYYADESSMKKLKRQTGMIRERLVGLESETEKAAYVERLIAENSLNTVEESSRIYFGIDNMEMFCRHQKEDFIPKETVFPLRRVLWEGEWFFAPNRPEDFLEHEFENPWDFPSDIGIPGHYKIDVEKEQQGG